MEPPTLDNIVKEAGIPRVALDQKCSDEHLTSISLFLDWRRVAPHLGLHKIDIDDIESKRTESEKRLETLSRWKMKYSINATFINLVQILMRIGCSDDAEKVCQLLKPQIHEHALHSTSPNTTDGDTATMFDPPSQGEESGILSEEGEEVGDEKQKDSRQDPEEHTVDQGMKYEVKNESESEYLNSIHTCYHNSFYLLRIPIAVGSKPIEIQLHKGSPILTCQHSGQELSVSLSTISRKVAPLLLKHGVYHVDTFYYERVPLFSVVFSSKASLKRFLSLASGQVKGELESAIGEVFTKQLSLPPADTALSSQLCQVTVSLDTELYLVTPDRQNKTTAEVHLVTLANYSHYSSKWQDSRIFAFSHLFQSQLEQTQGSPCSQKEEYAELEDLVKELKPVTQWFHLGMKLDISKETLLEMKHDGRSTAECRRHMLMEWGRRERPTWSKVVGALTAIRRKQLAEKVAVKYGTSVPAQQRSSATALPMVLLPFDSEKEVYQSREAAEHKDTEYMQSEEKLMRTEKQLKIANGFRDVAKKGVLETTKNLQQLQIELQRVVEEKEDIQAELSAKAKMYEGLHELIEQCHKKLRKSADKIQLLEVITEEKEQEMKKFEEKLELKEHELCMPDETLNHLQEELSQKTKELEQESSKVLELEKEVKNLELKLGNKEKEKDMQLQQMTAKTISQDAYIGEIKLHLSSMTGELSITEEQVATYKNMMSGKEEKIAQLSQTLDSRNIQMKELKEHLKAKVAAAHPTTIAENLTAAKELVTIMIHVSKLSVELDEAKRERHQMMLKSESALQEATRLRHSIKELKNMIPDPNKCRAVGVGLESAEKHQFSTFKVEVVNTGGSPCTGSHNITVELKSRVDESITTGSVVSKTPAIHEITYQPSRSGEHEISVKVNSAEINGSPFSLLVHNIPQLQNCKAFGKGIQAPVKNKLAEFTVQLADAEGDPCVTKQEVTAELKSLTDDVITKADVVSETPATYEVSYQPSRSGEYKLSVKVNDMEINGSPFALLVHNIPHTLKCKAIGEGITKAEKCKSSTFIVQLADAEGDPCVTKQEVTAELKSLTGDVLTKANIVSKTPATYEVSYQPSRSGEHELSVKVNGMEINGSPFALLVHNIPHPLKCKAIGEGITKAEKCKSSTFIVQLADAESDPCVSKQEVTVEIKSLVDGSVTTGSVVSKTPATYEVSYQPSRSGEHELSIKFKGSNMHIKDSPFAVLVVNSPDPQNCNIFGKGIKLANKNRESKLIVRLADAEGDPCLTKQEVTAELKSKVDGSCTKVNVVSKTPATYEATYRPNMAGEHVLCVEVNGEAIHGSPFTVNVRWKPELIRVIDGLLNPHEIATSSGGMIVVIEHGGLSLLSKDGQRIRTIGLDMPCPTAVAVDGTGNIYTVSSGKVYKLNYDGEVKGVSSDQNLRNFGIAVGQGNVFFGGTIAKSNTISGVVRVFDIDLKLITSFNISSSNFKLSCDSAGNLHVHNLTEFEVNVFSPDGTRLRTIRPTLESLITYTYASWDTCMVQHVDCNTYIYVTHRTSIVDQKLDQNTLSITFVFDKACTLLTSLQHSYLPSVITTDEDGFMYFCNCEKGCIEVFH